MTVDLICPGCGRKLRVAATGTTQSARCPSCNALFEVTGTGPVAPVSNAAPAPSPGWLVRIPEGLTYGPVSMEILESWVSQQRVTAECELHQEGASAWQSADSVFPHLQPVVHRSNIVPSAVVSSGPTARSVPPQVFRGGTAARREPHRGGWFLSWVSSVG